jgi:peptidyl-prolyl cis-trans isomerase C
MKRTLSKMVAGLMPVLVAASAAAQDAAAPAASTATPASAPAEPLFTDPVIAKGKGVEVKRSQLDSMVVSIKAEAAARRVTLPPTPDAQVLNDLIGFQLLWNKATEADRAKAREQFANALNQLKTNSNLSDEAFQKRIEVQLKAQGLTREQWEKQNIERAVIRPVLERELNILVKDDEARKYYAENPARFEEPEKVRASHILLSTMDSATRRELPLSEKEAKRKKIEELLKRIRAGEDFAALAKEFSEDTGSRGGGGEYTFARGQTMPEFEAAAFSLALNQVSDVVTTPNGYHLIKLLERRPAKKLEYDRVAADLKDFLKQQAIQKQAPAYLEKLRQEAGVEILDEKLKLATATLGLGGSAEAAKPDQPAEKK